MDLVFKSAVGPTPRRLTLLALADFVNPKTGRCHPSLATLAKKVLVSRSQVQKLARSLINDGLVLVVANERGGTPGTTPEYRLNLDRIARWSETDRVGATPTGSDSETPTGSETKTRPVAQTGTDDDRDGFYSRRETGTEDRTQTVIEPLGTRNRKTASRSSVSSVQNIPDHMLSEWMPLDSWHAFIEMRVSIKSAMTSHAQILLIKKLDRLRADGHDIQELLDTAVINNWKSVYPNATAKSGAKTDCDDLFRRGAA